MIVRRAARLREILTVALCAAAFLLAAIAGWVLLAMALGAEWVGMSVVAGIVVAPCLFVAVQILRMPPSRRAPLPVPASDGGCPADGRGCGGLCVADRLAG